MRDISSKWGHLVAERGFAQIPNYLLQINMFVHEDLKISPTEMVVLFQLIGSWWKKDEMPFPSMRTLADRSGISERQVQRAINSLEEKGYLKRTKAKIKNVIASNIYDLKPMLEILQTVAEHYVNKYPRNIKAPLSKKEIKRLDNEKPSTLSISRDADSGKFLDSSNKRSKSKRNIDLE